MKSILTNLTIAQLKFEIELCIFQDNFTTSVDESKELQSKIAEFENEIERR